MVTYQNCSASKINSNKSQTRCNSFSVYYPDIYLQLDMFRAFSRPSSGAQWLQWQPLVLPSYRGDSRAVCVVRSEDHRAPIYTLQTPMTFALRTGKHAFSDQKKLSAVNNVRQEILSTRLKIRKLRPIPQYLTQRYFLTNTVTQPLSGHLHLSSCPLSGICSAGNLLSAGRNSKMRRGRWRRCVSRRCAVWNTFFLK